MASDRANPRIAYEKSCCLSEGFLAYPMMRDPNTDPIPAPDPATPTVAAPAPMNRAAEVDRQLVAWTEAGLRLRRASRDRRGDRRVMADILLLNMCDLAQ